MREYGQVQCSLWARMETWSDRARVLAMYLLTGPHSNGIGCYRCPDGYVADDLGWTPETVAEGFRELLANGFCNRFGTVVFLPDFLRENAFSNANVATSRFREWQALPDGGAKSLAARALLTFGAHLKEAQITILRTVTETIREGFTEQDPTQREPREERKGARDEQPPADPPKPAGEPKPPRKPKRVRKPELTFLAFDAACCQRGEAFIAEDDPIHGWAQTAGIPLDFIGLAWTAFKTKYSDSEKTYADWRAVFRNAVRENWLKLWWFDQQSGECKLTTVGIQTQRIAQQEAA